MEITEVRVKLVEKSAERLRAFCSITLDGDFVIRDLKIIDGLNGAFVAMPSRKLADRCPRCGSKNHLRARFCNDCGAKLNEGRAPKDPQGRAKLHADVAHPINAGCRERIQNAVIEAFEAEVERSKQPDYKPPTFDDFDDDDFGHEASPAAPAAPAAGTPQPQPEAEEPVAPRAPKGSSKGKADDARSGAFDDYNSLIADLKREAAHRRGGPGEAAEGTEEEPAEPETPLPAPRRESKPPRERRSERSEGDAASDKRPAPTPAPRAVEPPPVKPAAPPPQEEDDFASGLL